MATPLLDNGILWMHTANIIAADDLVTGITQVISSHIIDYERSTSLLST